MQVADDGRGLDLRDIRSRAVERGLLAADAMPTDAEIARLTLLPGFSTRDMVTEISGRGVGLDVVATRLRALAGSIDIRSQQGLGLTIELRFQASLVATHALFVRDGGQVFGIASHAVRRAVPAVAVNLVREGGALLARLDEGDYPAHELASLTGLASATAPERRNLVLVDTETGPLGLLVDAILDAGELVTRPAGRYLKRIPGVAGIGLLGNGSVIPLLDVAELVRSPQEQHLRAAAEARSQAQMQRRSRVMVVDDSLSVRRAIASLLEDHGYEVVLARDGLEAVKLMDVVTSRRAADRSRNAQHERPRALRARALARRARGPDHHHDHFPLDGQTSPPGNVRGRERLSHQTIYRSRVAATRVRSRYRTRREARGCGLGHTRDLS